MDRRIFLSGAIALCAAPALSRESVRLRDLYNKDLSFTDYALANEGLEVEISGFMAPPLKAESDFFVLTTRPMAICPFCDSEADWPNDILAVYAGDIVTIVPFNVSIIVRGKLELGTYRDAQFGFVSRVRLRNASYYRV